MARKGGCERATVSERIHTQEEMTALAHAAAGLTVVLALYGTVESKDPWPALIGIAFSTSYAYALRRVALSDQPPRFQLLIALWLVGLSFALHLSYLPAGIGCFFTLMLCKTELLLPAAPKPKKQ
jgi:hypothetical protein